MKMGTFFFVVVFIVLLLHAKCSFSIPVACKPCSDEEVLMAVCISDFGKYVHAQTHTHTHIQAVIVCYFGGLHLFFVALKEKIAATSSLA